MDNISFENFIKQTSPEIKTKVQENNVLVTQSKNDSVEFSGNKDNTEKKDNKKKTIISVACAVATVIVLSFIGNKYSSNFQKLGENIDKKLLDKSNIFGKAYGGITSFFGNIKSSIAKKIPENGLIANLKNTFKNKLHMEFNLFRGYERGPIGIFINTLKDIFSNSLFKNRSTDISNMTSILSKKVSQGSVDDLLSMANNMLSKVGITQEETDALKDVISKLENTKQKVDNGVDLSKIRTFLSKKIEQSSVDDLLSVAKNVLSKDGMAQKEIDILNGAVSKLENIQQNLDPKTKASLEKLVGQDKIEEIFNGLANGVDVSKEKEFFVNFISSFVENMQKNVPQLANKSRAEILELAKKNKLTQFGGPDVSEFVGIQIGGPVLSKGAVVIGVKNLPKNLLNILLHPLTSIGNGISKLTCDWWPVNIIDSIGKKINPNFQFGRANLFDSMTKFDAIAGSGAKTLPGKAAQFIPTLLTESPSNFVNDKSGLGVLLCANLVTAFNDIQDSPKDKKLPTATDGIIGAATRWTLETPVSLAIVYGLATLKKLPASNNIISKFLKLVGTVAGLGLGENGNAKPMAIVGGSIIRFTLYRKISAKVSNVINSVLYKLFGKPYDRTEEQKQKELEEQKNAIIPEIGMSQNEFMQKLQQHPEIQEKLANDPEFLKEFQNNPMIIVNMLKDNVTSSKTNTNSSIEDTVQHDKSAFTKAGLSKANLDLLNNRANNNPTNNTELFGIKQKQESESKATDTENSYDSATYIPSSDFTAPENSYSDTFMKRYNEIMQDADKQLKIAEQYI